MRHHSIVSRSLLLLGVSLICAYALTGCSVVEDGLSDAPLPDPPTGESKTIEPWAERSRGPTAEREAALADLQVEATVEPVAPRAGEPLVFHLDITNPADWNVDAITVGTGGPWDSYRLLSIRPEGVLRRDPAGWYVLSTLTIPAGETRRLDIAAIPQQFGDSTFSFSARERTISAPRP
jgi:hypothetical protein